MNVYAIGILASIVLYLLIGNYAGRKVKHLDDYFVAGRGASTLFIVGTLVASFLSTTAFLAETGFTYDGYGVVLLAMTAINSIGYVVGALFFGRFLRRSRSLTVAEYFGQRFNSHRVQTAAGITIVVGLTAYLLAVTQGASLLISEVMEIPYGTSIFIVWAGYTLFTLYAGSRGVIITDTIMFLLFTIVAFIALYFIVDGIGGWFTTITSLATYEAKPGIISWHGMIGPEAKWQTPVQAMTWALTLGVSWGLVVAVSPWQSSRYLMAKNEHVVIRSACIASGAILLLYIALVVSAAAINLHNPGIDPSEKVMIWAALNILPTIPGILLMAGITAAALSSGSTFLSLVGFSASHDIFKLKATDDKKLLRMSRYIMLLTGFVILILAYFQPPNIMWISYFAGTLFASSWGPVAFMSVWSKTITADAAFWGIVGGFVGNIIAKSLALMEVISLPFYLDPFVIGLIISVVLILAVSHSGNVTSEESTYRSNLHQTPVEEFDPLKLKHTLLLAKTLVITGVATIVLMIIFYVRPYVSASNMAANQTQEILAGGIQHER